MDYKEKYERAIRQAKEELKCCGTLDCDAAKQIFKLFPELEEEVMDKRIKAALLYFFKRNKEKETDGVCNKDIFDWLKKQCKPNPYSGVSFEYNGHAWGMCARDGGVEILVDGEVKERVFLDNSRSEQNTTEFDDTNAKRMFIKALERVEELKDEGYKLTDCDKNSWWEDFKTYTSCIDGCKPAEKAEPKFHESDF